MLSACDIHSYEEERGENMQTMKASRELENILSTEDMICKALNIDSIGDLSPEMIQSIVSISFGVTDKGTSVSLKKLGDAKKYLYISENVNLESLDVLKHFTNLTNVEFNIDTLSQDNIMTLSKLTSLRSITFHQLYDLDYSRLVNIPTLYEINIHYGLCIMDEHEAVFESLPTDQRIKLKLYGKLYFDKNLDFIHEHPNIASIEMSVRNQDTVDDIEILSSLDQLEELSLSLGYQPVIPLRFDRIIHEKAVLRQFKIRNDAIQETNPSFSLDGIENAQCLEVFSLVGLDIDDISALSNVSTLREFYLGGSSITNIQGLENSLDLSIVVISDCPIYDLRPLNNASELTKIEINRCQLSDISALTNKPKLTYLDLDTNQIVDISPLNGSNIRNLYIANNPLDNNIARDTFLSIPTLQYYTISQDIGTISGARGMTEEEAKSTS